MREGAKIKVPFELKLSAKLLRYRAINMRINIHILYIYTYINSLLRFSKPSIALELPIFQQGNTSTTSGLCFHCVLKYPRVACRLAFRHQLSQDVSQGISASSLCSADHRGRGTPFCGPICSIFASITCTKAFFRLHPKSGDPF